MDVESILEEYYAKPEELKSKIRYRHLLHMKLIELGISAEKQRELTEPLLKGTSWEEHEIIAKAILEELELMEVVR